MTDVPQEFIPDERRIIADRPVCPGCEQELHGAELEYTCRKFDGETWHIECFCEQSDSFSREEQRYCPSCYAFSPWYPSGEDDTARLCRGCGCLFEDTMTKSDWIAQQQEDSR
jgi:hypothetical protein